MPFQLQAFSDVGLDEALLRLLIDEHDRAAAPELARFWAYYRNPREARRGGAGAGLWGGVDAIGGASRGRLAQECGLPPRLRGRGEALGDDRVRANREIVIENDIAWRLHAMVDFLFGRPIQLLSTAKDERVRREIEAILDAVFETAGGSALLQDMALLACIYGHIDLLLRADDLFERIGASGGSVASAGVGDAAGGIERVIDFARQLRIELIEPPRAIPLQSPRDFRRLNAMIIRFTRQRSAAAVGEIGRSRFLAAAIARLSGTAPCRRATTGVVEIHSAARRQLYENERLSEDAPNPLGEIPVVHIQNISQPFQFAGLSEVEPLIPLQDELNTRMSDRAHRVTMQSFKMYLAKGLGTLGAGGGAPTTIGPGQIWSTDNETASVEAFGGDSDSPSEESHIEQIRQAMDKASSVTPVAAGVIRAKLGQLSSESALRVTLTGMLAKTARKQVTYGRGLAELSRLILVALDAAGVYRTAPSDRGVRVQWPELLPRGEKERLEAALMKQQLGVSAERVLGELGYAPADGGVG